MEDTELRHIHDKPANSMAAGEIETIVDAELRHTHDKPAKSMATGETETTVNVPPAPTRSGSTYGMRRGASTKRLASGVEVEVVEVGRFCKFVAAWPATTMFLLFAFIVGFCAAVGIPGYFAFLDGGKARRSLESRTSDAFLKVQEISVENMGVGVPRSAGREPERRALGRGLGGWRRTEDALNDGEDGEGKKCDAEKTVPPLTQEAFSESLQFWMQSKSGNMLSEENLASYSKILDDVTAALGGFCLQTTESGCAAPHSITADTMSTSAAEVLAFLKTAESDQSAKKTADMFVGSDIDFVAGTTSWLKGRVRVGGPLPNFCDLEDREEEQAELYEAEYKAAGSFGAPTSDGWIVKIQDIIKDAEKDNGDIRVYFVGGNNLLPRMFQGLFFDVGLAMFAIALVGLFMWLQVGSVLLCVCGMFQILASFMLTLSTWKLVGNGAFTFMHGLVIYIVLGVGADDIFVFIDAWKQSRSQASTISGSVSTRLQWSLSRAAKAMLVTSITTCAAFLLTAMTDLPIIATFGSFASLVITWNFILVITWFPACVVAHECYVVRPAHACLAARCCGCGCVACAGQWGVRAEEVPACGSACGGGTRAAQAPAALSDVAARGGAGAGAVEAGDEGREEEREEERREEREEEREEEMEEEREEEREEEKGEEKGEGGKEGLRWVERVFHDSLFGFLSDPRHRVLVFVVFGLLFVAGLCCAASGVRLTDRAVTETYLVDGHPLQVTLNLLVGTEDAFKPADDARKRAGYLMFGVDPSNPIDRSGTDALSDFEELDKVGAPVYVGVDLAAEASQEAIVAACDTLKRLPSVLVYKGESGEAEVHCFMSDLKNFRLAMNLSFPVPAGELVGALWEWRFMSAEECPAGVYCYKNRFNTGVAQGRANNEWYQDKTNFYAEGAQVRAAFISGNLTVPRMEQDLTIIEPEHREWRDAAASLDFPAGASGAAVIGLTGRLEWIAVMHALVTGVKTGVPASLAIAFAVLVVSTANWLVALLATVTILGVMSTFFITFVASGWVLGMYECMFLQLTAGMAVDYTVHLAHAYNESSGATRREKMQEALTEMGVSVLSGAVSTLGASICLFVCSFKVFYLYGSFIFFVILWAILWALIFFPSLMITVGPSGDLGDIKLFRSLFSLLSGGPAAAAASTTKQIAPEPHGQEARKETPAEAPANVAPAPAQIEIEGPKEGVGAS